MTGSIMISLKIFHNYKELENKKLLKNYKNIFFIFVKSSIGIVRMAIPIVSVYLPNEFGKKKTLITWKFTCIN